MPKNLQAPKMRVLLDLELRTSDGTRLRTDAYLPPVGTTPTILVRTPYGRNMPLLLLMTQSLNRVGLGVVLQDSRGRYQSEGEFDFLNEEYDTAETLTWLARQEWCDGKIGLLGMSMSSYPNFKVAGSKGLPQGVKFGAIASLMGMASYRENFFRDGVLILHWGLPWLALIRSTTGGLAWKQQSWMELFEHIPLVEVAERLELDADTWRGILAGGYDASFWQDLEAYDCLPNIDAPTLHVSGWYDFMLPQTLATYEHMAKHGKQQQLIIGPWDHQSLFKSFGEQAAQGQGGLDMMQVVVDFFRRSLLPDEGSENGDGREIRLFVEHQETWIETDSLPLPASRILDLYLSAGRDARSADGDGWLSLQAPPSLAHQTFVYDPRDPVPTLGGAVWPFDTVGLKPGPADQTKVEDRLDVLVYTGDVLEEDLWAVGSVQVELFAATSASDTDFTAKLVDVGEDEIPRIVADGIVRGRYSQAQGEEGLLRPQQPTRFLIDLRLCGHCFLVGHQIRLEIASSNFPKFDRNLNSASPLHLHSDILSAQQTVFHGGSLASRLRLTIIDPTC